MGCTESLPEPTSYNNVHKVDPRYPAIGKVVGAGPSTNGPTQLIVKEKIFSWSGDDFRIKHPNGSLFGNGLKIKGKVFAFRDQMALVDGNGQMLAVCLKKFEFMARVFKIYVPYPVRPNQAPSQQNYNGQKLFTLCEVRRVPFSTTQEVIMDGDQSATYWIQRAGSIWPKKRLVKHKGIPAALMEGGTFDMGFNSYRITVNPGIDPCLIVCLCAICDEMDEDANRN